MHSSGKIITLLKKEALADHLESIFYEGNYFRSDFTDLDLDYINVPVQHMHATQGQTEA